MESCSVTPLTFWCVPGHPWEAHDRHEPFAGQVKSKAEVARDVWERGSRNPSSEQPGTVWARARLTAKIDACILQFYAAFESLKPFGYCDH